jgi:hypothetical protein
LGSIWDSEIENFCEFLRIFWEYSKFYVIFGLLLLTEYIGIAVSTKEKQLFLDNAQEYVFFHQPLIFELQFPSKSVNIFVSFCPQKYLELQLLLIRKANAVTCPTKTSQYITKEVKKNGVEKKKFKFVYFTLYLCHAYQNSIWQYV